MYVIISLIILDFEIDGVLRAERKCILCQDQWFSPNGLNCIPLPSGLSIANGRLTCATGFKKSFGKCISLTYSADITKYSLENAKRVKYNVFNESFNLKNSLLVDSDFIKGKIKKKYSTTGFRLARNRKLRNQ